MIEPPSRDWHFRQDGRVTITAHGVADPTPFHRCNAYIKAAEGVALSEAERQAVEAGQSLTMAASTASGYSDRALCGYLYLHAPEHLESIDRLAERIAERLGLPEAMAWSALVEYCESARSYAFAELEEGDGGQQAVMPLAAGSGEIDGWSVAELATGAGR